MPEILIPVSPGEMIDRLSILSIKSERFTDEAKLERVNRALSGLLARVAEIVGPDKQAAVWPFHIALKATNEAIWDAEEEVRRDAWRDDAELARLARDLHNNNDERFRLKREIDVLMGSDLVEEKSYR